MQRCSGCSCSPRQWCQIARSRLRKQRESLRDGPHIAVRRSVRARTLLNRRDVLGVAGLSVALQGEGGAQALLTIPSPSATEKIGTPYDRFSPSYDQIDNGAPAAAFGFPRLRQQLLDSASGAVLECGVGTGINLPFYNFKAVTLLTGLDNSSGMLAQAGSKVSRMHKSGSVELLQGSVESMPFDSESFDTVVDTFSLCVYQQPLTALKEMARVLKPGGSVLLLAHTRSNNLILGIYQDVTSSAVTAMGKGCQWNQDLPAFLKKAGLRSVSFERHVGGTISMIRAVKTA